jgi:hypothetical protein
VLAIEGEIRPWTTGGRAINPGNFDGTEGTLQADEFLGLESDLF